ncbi:MAG: uracil-DNA glycosylase [Anaerolineae bacterium]|nr:uracil-DNA glycosylase [Anaerolineae bacterium]
MDDYSNLEALHTDLTRCRRCAEAGYHIEGQPVFSGSQSARLMLIGQAPGVTEVKLGYPFGGSAGQRLFKWLAQAGWEESGFRATCYMTSVTKCFPGQNPKGNGDRVPSAAEQKLCRPWLDGELALVEPEIIVPIGGLAIRLFYSPEIKLEDVIGKSMVDDAGRQIVPLPHPSGASRWHSNPRHLGQIEQALFCLRMLKAEHGL